MKQEGVKPRGSAVTRGGISNRIVRFGTGLSLAVVLLAVPSASVVSGSLDVKPATKAKLEGAVDVLANSAAHAVSGDLTAAQQEAGRAVADFLLPAIGEESPDWFKRFEFDLDLRENSKPEWSVLTVQPLFQGENKAHTVFTQLRLARNHQFGDARTTTNAGLGYRGLLLDNSLLLGGNAFFDHEWDFDHNRISVGIEAKWHNFDFFGNVYEGLSSKRNEVVPGTSEEALDGYDVELASQVPYLRWAKIRGKLFQWDSVRGSNNDGWSLGGEVDVHQNLRVEFGVTDDDERSNEAFLRLTFRAADPKRPVMLSCTWLDNKTFHARDMRDHTLDRVRRTNEIVVGRNVGATVTISRGT